MSQPTQPHTPQQPHTPVIDPVLIRLSQTPSDNSRAHQPSLSIENLGLPTVLQNPHVQAIYHDWRAASKQIVQINEVQQALYQENIRLRQENATLQSQLIAR